MPVKTYIIRSHYLVPTVGWKTDEAEFTGTYDQAGSATSAVAKSLDAQYGDSHFWTVELHDSPQAEYGAYFQLFHGRTS